MSKLAIIGGGLFGTVIADWFEYKDWEVDVFDNEESNSAVRCSGSLMRPSWYAGLPKNVIDASLGLLHELYDVETITFTTNKLVKVDVERIPIWGYRDYSIYETVTMINSRYVFTNELIGTHGPYDGVVVAAGIWTNVLLHRSNLPTVEGLKAKAGISCFYKGVTEPEISVWAPYKQLVKFNMSGTENLIWAGDGTAIYPQNLTEARIQQTVERCNDFVGQGKPAFQHVGYRPFVQGVKSCIVEELVPNTFVATGGAKNGSIGAGYAASVIWRCLTGDNK